MSTNPGADVGRAYPAASVGTYVVMHHNLSA